MRRIPILAALLALTIPNVARAQQAAPPAPVATPLTITVTPGERQVFGGLGGGTGNWNRDYQKLTEEERTQLSEMIWSGLGMKSLRLWLNLNEYAPKPGDRLTDDFKARYIDSGLIQDAQKNGVVDLVLAPDNCPDYLKVKREGGPADYAIPDERIREYCALIAGFIKQIRVETGVQINVTGLQNEPNDLDRFEARQMPLVVKELRAQLNVRRLDSVKIIATENANVDDSFYAQLDALKLDPEAWSVLDGIASHSYNMAATDRAYSYIEGTPKTYWMTEASANGPEEPGDDIQSASLATRFLSDMNHGVTHWMHFLNFESVDPNDNATRIIAYTPAPLQMTIFQKYWSYQYLSRAFDVGATFRASQSSLERDMVWTYGPKPRLTAATAKNPDGSWAIALSNFTAPTFAEKPDNTGYANGYKSQTFDVTVEVPELKDVPRLGFTVKRLGTTEEEGEVEMKNGVIVIPGVKPLQLVTLRSLEPPPTPEAAPDDAETEEAAG